jgi:prepilin-type N-terminal cleavage/methylation domain-containing protein
MRRLTDGGRRPVRLRSEAGVTLIEVLAAIMVMAIGLLALLTLFPLGVLSMARAIRDDRTAALAAHALDVSERGESLLRETMEFVQISMAKRSADPDEADRLRDEYEQLAKEFAELEIALADLQYVVPRPAVQRYIEPLLLQVRAIQRYIATAVQLLSLVEIVQPTS